MRGHDSSCEKVPPHPVVFGEVVRLPTVGQDMDKEFSAFGKFVKMIPLTKKLALERRIIHLAFSSMMPLFPIAFGNSSCVQTSRW